MKITNMEEYGRAVDTGETIQSFPANGVFEDVELRDTTWADLVSLVRAGRIRTKPKYITLYEYYVVGSGYHFWDVNDGNKTHLGRDIARSGTKPITAEIEE